MMSQSHLRRSSKASFFLDIEKSPSYPSDNKNMYDEEDQKVQGQYQKHKRDFINWILSIVLFLLIIGTFFNAFFLKISHKLVTADTDLVSNEAPSQHYELLDDVYTDEVNTPKGNEEGGPKSLLSTLWGFLKFELAPSAKELAIESHLIDIDFIPFDREAPEELWKLDDQDQYIDYQREQSKERTKTQEQQREKEYPQEDYQPDEDIDAHQDLKEILSVSPVIILVSGDQEETESKESQALKILLKSITITPQPLVVNLMKHPHYFEIYKYLKDYHNHELSSLESPSSPIKDDVKYNSKLMRLVNDDLSGDIEATVYDQELIDSILREESDDDDSIPRLFIGGKPVGTYGQIIKLHSEGQLLEFLKAQDGESISVSL